MIGKDAQVQVQRRCAVRNCRSGRNEPRAFIEVGALGLLVPQLAKKTLKTVCQSACFCADCDGVRRTNHEINNMAARISYS